MPLVNFNDILNLIGELLMSSEIFRPLVMQTMFYGIIMMLRQRHQGVYIQKLILHLLSTSLKTLDPNFQHYLAYIYYLSLLPTYHYFLFNIKSGLDSECRTRFDRISGQLLYLPPSMT